MLEPTKKSQPGDSGGFIHSRTKRQTEIKYVYKTKKKDMIHILEINNTSTQKMHVCVFSAVRVQCSCFQNQFDVGPSHLDRSFWYDPAHCYLVIPIFWTECIIWENGCYLGNHLKTHHLDNVMISFHYCNKTGLDVGPFCLGYWQRERWKGFKQHCGSGCGLCSS